MVRKEIKGKSTDTPQEDPLMAEVTQVTSPEQLKDQELVEALIREGRILKVTNGVRGGALEREIVYTIVVFPIKVSKGMDLYYPTIDSFILEAEVNEKTYRSQIFNVDDDLGRWISHKFSWDRRLQPLRALVAGVKDGLRSALRG